MLTKKEYEVLCGLQSAGFTCIARDSDCGLWAYNDTLTKTRDAWWPSDDARMHVLDNCLFAFIKWEQVRAHCINAMINEHQRQQKELTTVPKESKPVTTIDDIDELIQYTTGDGKVFSDWQDADTHRTALKLQAFFERLLAPTVAVNVVDLVQTNKKELGKILGYVERD